MKALAHYLSVVSNYSPIYNCDDIEAATNGLNEHITQAYENFCPIKIIKVHSDYVFKPSAELLKNINIKRKLYRKYKKEKSKHPDSNKCKKLWEAYKEFKNKHVTKISKRDRKQNTVDELKAKSAKNDLKGVWQTIKIASNLPTMKTNSRNCNEQLDAEELNKFFTSIGQKVQAEIPISHEFDNFFTFLCPEM